jgi:hypothetical protein
MSHNAKQRRTDETKNWRGPWVFGAVSGPGAWVVAPKASVVGGISFRGSSLNLKGEPYLPYLESSLGPLCLGG